MSYERARQLARTKAGWHLMIQEFGHFAKWSLFSKTGKYAHSQGIIPISKLEVVQ